MSNILRRCSLHLFPSGFTRSWSRMGEWLRCGCPVSGPRRPERRPNRSQSVLRHTGTGRRLTRIVSGRVGRQSVSWDDSTNLPRRCVQAGSSLAQVDLLALLLALLTSRSTSSFLSLAAVSSPSSHVLSISGCSSNVDVVFPGDPWCASRGSRADAHGGFLIGDI